MTQYEEETKEIEVPSATGVPGLQRVLGEILRLQRVQEVTIVPGRVSYRRFRKPEEPEAELNLDLETLMPAAVVRSHPITEVLAVDDNAAVVVSQLFTAASMDGLNPVAFVGGTDMLFHQWHARSTNVVLRPAEVYGLPFLTDTGIPDEALLLCAAYSRQASMIDTVRSYKVTIPIKLRSKGG